jgi:hypothetical protein
MPISTIDIPQKADAGKDREVLHASIWRPMADAPKDGTPILAKIKDGLMIPVDGVEKPFWWSGKRIAVVPQKRGDETRWELDAIDSWWEFGEHEIEGWAPLP